MAIKKLTNDLRGEIVAERARLLADAPKTLAKKVTVYVCRNEWCYEIDEELRPIRKWVRYKSARFPFDVKELAQLNMEQEFEEAIRTERERLAEGVRSSLEEAEQMRVLLDDVSWWERSLSRPVELDVEVLTGILSGLMPEGGWDDSRPYLFQNSVYVVKGLFTGDQDKLLVQEEFDSERRKFERLQRKFERCDSEGQKVSRQQIPEEVRIAVWRRDGGTCAKCGSRERLEYDHIIPVSRGGGNTARNIELLCEACNRAKSNHIV